MDSGDVIYLVLIVLFSLISLLNKKNKKAKAAAQQDASQPSVEQEVYSEEQEHWPDLEEFFRSLGRDDAMPEVVPEPAQEKVVLSYETADDYSELKVKKRIKGNVVKSKSQFTKMSLNEEDVEDDFQLDISFDEPEDVQRAFIYSEIFSRKYS